MTWTVYILRCNDGSFYIGHTKMRDDRIARHQSGNGASHTAQRRPVSLIYHESAPDKASAIAREKQIKNWSRAKKKALIQGDKDLLKQRSRPKSTLS